MRGTTDPSPDLAWRRLTRDELPLIWAIDRREVIDRIYELRDGELVVHDEHYDMQGWPPGEAEHGAARLAMVFDRGGAFLGAWDGGRLVAVAVVDTMRLGPRRDLVQLSFLHVGRDHRDRGLGRRLFEASVAVAAERGAAGLYVSATPSEHTIGFYLRRGCKVLAEPDPDLFALEPEDIHLEWRPG